MANWRIINDIPQEDLEPTTGAFRPTREITFEILDSGRRGTIRVELRNYTPEYVQSEIQNYADRIAKIGTLGQ